MIERREVIKNKGVTSAQVIEFTDVLAAKKCLVRLRRTSCRDEETGAA